MHKGKKNEQTRGLLEEVIVGKSKEVIGEIIMLNLLQNCKTGSEE